MSHKTFLLLSAMVMLLASCAVSNNAYNPNRQFSRQALEQDYTLLRQVLEKKHPALYWYTPKDSMHYYFDSLYNNIADSMTELQFGWEVVAPLLQKIRCGHTSFGMSDHWNKYIQNKSIPSFPLQLKLWNDTMVVTASLNKKDSVFKKGTLITSINGWRNAALIQKMFQSLPVDGYANNVNYQRLSSDFPYFHRSVFGIYKNYRIGYIDSTGAEKTTLMPMFMRPISNTKKDNLVLIKEKRSRSFRRAERVASFRSLQMDTATLTATLTLRSFANGEGKHLKRFVKGAFKSIAQQKIKNLIIDLRNNGGGDVTRAALLAQYLRYSAFKVADTAYAAAKNFRPFTSHIRHGFFNHIALFFLTKKQQDGAYHFGFWERHWYHPKTKQHFNGPVYVLINGFSFSATSIFCNLVKGQANIQLVGEETGGGAYGNSGLLIPDLELPNTKLKVRLPFFKVVQFRHGVKDGLGIAPDIFIPPTVEGIKNGVDRKMQMVKALLEKKDK